MSKDIDRLVYVMALLRSPGGCPWDREQDFKSITSDTLEEAYEVVEAIENNDMNALREELGDLLLQVVFYAQMAHEKDLFDFDDVASGLTGKLIERHPHVFADKKDILTREDVRNQWESGKAAKREAKARANNEAPGILDDVNTALPAMSRALKLSKRAARVGFDWPQASDILAKLREETAELEAEIAAGAPKDKMTDELGDVFFVLVNLARHFDIDPETALRSTNRKFEHRFRGIEARLAAEGKTASESNLDEMERLWAEVKAEEKR